MTMATVWVCVHHLDTGDWNAFFGSAPQFSFICCLTVSCLPAQDAGLTRVRPFLRRSA